MPSTSRSEGRQPTQLYIKSKAGDDRIKIDADVMLPVSVEAGDGNDSVTAGGGPSRLFGGNGNDRLQLGGRGYAEGNEGDDTIMGALAMPSCMATTETTACMRAWFHQQKKPFGRRQWGGSPVCRQWAHRDEWWQG
jgi:N-acetylglucosamine kinase-like BadF-type ATPase